ncbi:Dcp2 [Fragilaria crotonensis]|nr:Dcp2 [Fragilaria crotonensis]
MCLLKSWKQLIAFFQLEQAYWFYDDFHCDNSDLPLPRFKSLKPFALKMFQISPLLAEESFAKMWEQFSAYKRGISTYGTILLNEDCTKMILCKVWQSNSWTYPAGKVNQHETGTDAGARETYEETGFDPNCSLGETKRMLDSGELISWKPLQEEDALVVIDAGKRRTMYVCRGVPIDFPFAPVARKEVADVQWHSVDDIPKKSFAVLPFMKQLRRWIKTRSRPGKKQPTPGPKRPSSTKKPRSANNSSRGRNNSRGRVRDDDPLTTSGLASAGEISGWTEADMFKVNEQLIGRKVEYDGNPHFFAEKGFDGRDPHAFRVVGGTFMNSGGISSLAPPPEQSKLQPLFRRDAEEEGELRPFFSTSGETPWGEVVSHAEGPPPPRILRAEDRAPISTSRHHSAGSSQGPSTALVTANDLDTAFLTDAEVTVRSQTLKGRGPDEDLAYTGNDLIMNALVKRQAGRRKHTEHKHAIQKWVQTLREASQSSQLSADFRFDVDAIMASVSDALRGEALIR